jgi:hypothetical protein
MLELCLLHKMKNRENTSHLQIQQRSQPRAPTEAVQPDVLPA